MQQTIEKIFELNDWSGRDQSWNLDFCKDCNKSDNHRSKDADEII